MDCSPSPTLRKIRPYAARALTTTRVKGKMVRINKPAEDGRPSLGQGEIARWPHDSGIRLGALGEGL
jgi:hypothetical protein